MKFDMNRAWGDAMALFAANREVVAVVGGVFFLLPGFAVGILFADMIEQAVRDLLAMALAAKLSGQLTITAAVGNLMGLFVLLGLLKVFGAAALLALLNDRGRPTLGQALATAGMGMPSLIGALLLFSVGVLLASVPVSLIAIPIQMLLGPGAAEQLIVYLYLAVIFYAATRLSMTLALIVLDKVLNPLTVLRDSWKLTRENTWRLIGFFLLLLIPFVTITLVLGWILLPALEEILGGGAAGVTISNLIASVIDALVWAVFTCLVAAIHRQLSGSAVDLR